ncbi:MULTISPECIES: wax ester/triacylglycerol synthase domain-containing protein [Microbacterium]|uniref:wax ester/triacylglycerol synthase domain-containing protein n=1 Tax=Microbacterium TaxID=33882 RepID=UPI002788E9B9|nr:MULTISPECIES: wax ester/triacylglycerol synthase domain-containing protein [Microbacterium]MDQ1082509.1 diacylglycerol O-acyltransferase [Microbacterium sp. SORGH_AS_0344]MDQ1168720.1 diacylglycerol O-acyltransferase [Microbacterium proteolyticum]
MREALTPADARILALESDVVHGHALKLLVLEPGEALDLEAVRGSVAARLAAFPRGRQVVIDDGDGPAWVDVDDVDLAHHVRRHAAQDPVELRAVVGRLMSEPLDRSRPLWTVDLVGPLTDGREAVAVRLHHALADGLTAVRFLESVIFEPHDAPAHEVGVRDPAARPTRWSEWERMPMTLARELGHPGSRSPFDRPITARRALAFVDVPLSEARSVGASRPQHATVNDVLLAVIAGALRRRLLHHGHTPRMNAQVPVSLHEKGEDAAASGNRDSFVDVGLHLDEPDDLRRLDLLSAQMRVRKHAHDARSLDELFHALAAAGPVGTRVRSLADDPREFGLAISNVPGPRVPVAIAGRRVGHVYTSSEPGPRHALRVAAISNDRWLGVGFCVDPDAVPDVELLADAAHDAWEALRSGLH